MYKKKYIICDENNDIDLVKLQNNGYAFNKGNNCDCQQKIHVKRLMIMINTAYVPRQICFLIEGRFHFDIVLCSCMARKLTMVK